MSRHYSSKPKRNQAPLQNPSTGTANNSGNNNVKRNGMRPNFLSVTWASFPFPSRHLSP